MSTDTTGSHRATFICPDPPTVDPTRVDDLKARLAELEVSCRYRDSLTGEDQ